MKYRKMKKEVKRGTTKRTVKVTNGTMGIMKLMRTQVSIRKPLLLW